MPTKKKAVRKRTASPRKPILTFQGMLAELRRFFNEAGSDEQGQLWDVLSALRGPDEDCISSVKLSTTSVIRAVAFGGDSPASVGLSWTHEDRPAYKEVREQMARHEIDVSPHFRYHAKRAFSILGLAWDEVNDKSKFI